MIQKAFCIPLRNVRNSLIFSHTPMFCSQVVQVASKLRAEVEGEISHEESQMEDLSEYSNFFENQGWTVNYNGIQIELARKNGPYNLRLLFNAKTPMSMDQDASENPQSPEFSEEPN